MNHQERLDVMVQNRHKTAAIAALLAAINRLEDAKIHLYQAGCADLGEQLVPLKGSICNIKWAAEDR